MASISPGYTTTEKVRAALGVTDNEVLNEFFNQDLGTALELDLLDWYPDHAAVWAAYKAPVASVPERRAGMALQLFSMWFCTAEIAMLWLAMPQRISDSKDDMRRFVDVDLKAIVENAKNKRDTYHDQLLLLDDPDTVFGYTQMGSASPGYDPVTGIQT
jgi:hypothetical protein